MWDIKLKAINKHDEQTETHGHRLQISGYQMEGKEWGGRQG